MCMRQIVLDVPDDKYAELCALQQVLGLCTLKELFNTSLLLMQLATDKRQSGQVIASVDEEQQRWTELSMDCLDQVKPKP